MSFTPVQNPAVTYRLQKPIQYIGEPIEELAIREPTAGDVFRVGNPVKYDLREEQPAIEFDEQKAIAMLSRLTGIPVDGSLDRMTSNDAVGSFWAIARFFIPGLSTKPGEPLES